MQEVPKWADLVTYFYLTLSTLNEKHVVPSMNHREYYAVGWLIFQVIKHLERLNRDKSVSHGGGNRNTTGQL